MTVMASSFAAARGARRAVLYLLILAGAVQARPGPVAAPERKLKAAYMYRVATFVDWPDAAFARPDGPLLIGIAGDDALADEVKRFMDGRLVHGRPLAVVRIDPRAVPRGLHVLFVGPAPAHARLPDAVRTQPVLTVCDGAPVRQCPLPVSEPSGLRSTSFSIAQSAPARSARSSSRPSARSL